MKRFKEMNEINSSVKSRGEAVKAAKFQAKKILNSLEKREYYFVPDGESKGEVDGTFLINLCIQLEAARKRLKR